MRLRRRCVPAESATKLLIAITQVIQPQTPAIKLRVLTAINDVVVKEFRNT
jgi:hypothetical protein